MLSADKATAYSRKGTDAVRQRAQRERALRQQAWEKQQSDKTPERILEAERAVRHAAKRGERQVGSRLRFIRGKDYVGNFSRTALCKPHRDLLRYFEEAGYIIEFKYDWEPSSIYVSTESYEVILKW